MALTWEEWLVERESYKALPEDFNGRPHNAEECEIDGCKEFCVTLVRCRKHICVDGVKEWV